VRISLTVFDTANPYQSVEIRGTAELTGDPGKSLPRALSRKYLVAYGHNAPALPEADHPGTMGSVRCLLAAIRCEKGDVAANLAAHLDLVARAAAEGCQLAVFPEMSLTGSAEPATHPERLIPLTHPAVTELARASGATGIGVCFGIAERANHGPHITQVFAAAGQVAGVQRKRHLGEGEESFTPAVAPAVFEHAGTRFGVAICAESGHDAPFDAAAAAGARVVLFPAAP
jgi:predicted amidohydrolase